MHSGVLESAKYPEAFVPDRVDGKLAVPGTSNVKLHGIFRIHGGDHETTMDVQTRSGPDQIDATIINFDAKPLRRTTAAPERFREDPWR